MYRFKLGALIKVSVFGIILGKKLSYKKKRKFNKYHDPLKQVHLGKFQIVARVGLIFSTFFVLLFFTFVSAAKLPPKVIKPTIMRGATVNVAIPKVKNYDTIYAQLCRGKIKVTCTKLPIRVKAKTVINYIIVPATYPLGDAILNIVTVTDKRTTVVSKKSVKVIAMAKQNGGGGGGGGGGSSGGGSSSSSSSASSGSGSGSTENPGTPSGTIITATPTPTPAIKLERINPYLLNH